MKRNLSIIGVLFILLANACAPQATPTANPADIQNTAQAAAFTMVAETQQAIPTATRVPPTQIPSQTPLPSVTPIPLPTQGTQTDRLSRGSQRVRLSFPLDCRPSRHSQTLDLETTRTYVINLSLLGKGPLQISVYKPDQT
jgi:hypothetical protein